TAGKEAPTLAHIAGQLHFEAESFQNLYRAVDGFRLGRSARRSDNPDRVPKLQTVGFYKHTEAERTTPIVRVSRFCCKTGHDRSRALRLIRAFSGGIVKMSLGILLVFEVWGLE